MRTLLVFGGGLLAAVLGLAPQGQAQQLKQTLASNNDEPSYRKELIYGVNFNTRGGLIGGATVRSTKLLNQDWARFWSIDLVEVKHPKEQKSGTFYGGVIVPGKSNYFFVARPSVGVQRVIFRKAPDSGVQVNGLLSAGPSIGLLLPYYITYNYTSDPQVNPTDYRNEQFDPQIHEERRIIDRAPLFSGVSNTDVQVGAHIRGALSFEYGRYRDAVAGVEVGALVEAYTKAPPIIRARTLSDEALNDRFLPSVYLTVYLGSRN
ncbi:hypothetical protein ACFPAF_05080 [Hymenobacter endophyticus]|uniref:Outer membrane protein beta-barrel domain-containing protein n=1 Tax=Hymenobacter endophyticus TaxID=3076335 RepID=A0ABU3TEH2_9BACT|nr:hypothetical protein [Hymenobacter endophyticus]MDU0369759.1 hypothetical protein [Hymenobacter endophyticus]